MGRAIFKDGGQIKFLNSIRDISGLSNEGLAMICGVHSRTYQDWVRGKYSISEKALNTLLTKFDLPEPKNLEIVGDYWYVTKGARKGALRRMEIYGNIGTPKGRIKGGKNSQLRRKEDPEKYRLLGCNVRKNFKALKPSIEFAEAAGIILGDGCISNSQVRVTVSSLVDRSYAKYISTLFEQVFRERPTVIERNAEHYIALTLTGLNLVEELQKLGFKKGDKIRQQVDFPAWVWSNNEYQKACVRGLMDTDGGCYFHTHTINGLTYKNFGMCFTNYSFPLVQSMAKVLKSLGFKFSLTEGGRHIYLYSFKEVEKYFALIGSNNPKNWEKFNSHLNQKTHRLY